MPKIQNIAPPLILRNVEIDGREHCDVLIEAGRIVGMGSRLTGRGIEVDGRGGALIPGLIDHHAHLLGTAAERSSFNLAPYKSGSSALQALRAAAQSRPADSWLRVIGYHEHALGEWDRTTLDRALPDHPVRIQHQSGAMWLLNSRALAALGDDLPPSVERDRYGVLTGRIIRGDAWLRTKWTGSPPSLETIGRELSSFGITGVTDASVSNDRRSADILLDARRRGHLPQRLMIMSGGDLDLADDADVRLGPVKLVLDEFDPPSIESLAMVFAKARAERRNVGVHCVTDLELALALATFDLAGSILGDRIEHGGVIPAAAIPCLASHALTVVTQPAFILDRGDRYLDTVPEAFQGDLYRCRTLMDAGIPVAGSSDAPYATFDPWLAMKAATTRRTRGGDLVGDGERVSAGDALGLYLGSFSEPGRTRRRVRTGEPGDLCLLAYPLRDVLNNLDSTTVRTTIIDGAIVYDMEGR